ncbi:MAG TPA: hypothetical protein PLY00_11290 [Verrucomicrobiota bacterium]|nr:hypothetical protein [Verrucomicrobiota bacterium]HOA62510.1 hypothetical protein [Verrucomicrobiota bacterium]HOF48749.1 hypothetical protein [Verrucomicrobiota bacterium]HOG87097.1 hypothetical protein [Verrucomicrobiota bacterium]HOR71852.1 hypothetical protein [Verrucomicrobiota bacterium]
MHGSLPAGESPNPNRVLPVMLPPQPLRTLTLNPNATGHWSIQMT